jgi:hypothetical protein
MDARVLSQGDLLRLVAPKRRRPSYAPVYGACYGRGCLCGGQEAAEPVACEHPFPDVRRMGWREAPSGTSR